MPLSLGTSLGPYEIQAALGAGDMGEVYKARDTRLDRTVAIKVLPEHVADDTDLKQRFEREAKTIPSLNLCLVIIDPAPIRRGGRRAEREATTKQCATLEITPICVATSQTPQDARLVIGSGGWACCAASRHSYRWYSPPTRGNATTFALGDGRGATARAFGVSLLRPKWQRSSW